VSAVQRVVGAFGRHREINPSPSVGVAGWAGHNLSATILGHFALATGSVDEAVALLEQEPAL
jgi:hypothetical protein